MADNATSTVSDQARIAAGDSQVIHFRPGVPGIIGVHSLPSPHVVHTEAGLLAVGFIRRPGSTKPLTTVKFKVPSPTISDPSIRFSFNATAADLQASGDWTCEVFNASLDPITFATDVTFPVHPITIATASINIGFLNTLLTKVVDAASVQIHFESSSDGSAASRLSVAPDIAALAGIPTLNTFAVDDTTKSILGVDVQERILNLDSDPDYPIVVILSPPLELRIVIRFDTTNARLVAQNIKILGQNVAPDINVESFELDLVIGLDGSIQPECTASAHLAFNNLDFSDDFVNGVLDATNSKLHSSEFAALLDRKRVRAQIDKFFAQLLRLGPQAQIHEYRADGQNLVVSYSNT